MQVGEWYKNHDEAADEETLWRKVTSFGPTLITYELWSENVDGSYRRIGSDKFPHTITRDDMVDAIARGYQILGVPYWEEDDPNPEPEPNPNKLVIRKLKRREPNPTIPFPVRRP